MKVLKPIVPAPRGACLFQRPFLQLFDPCNLPNPVKVSDVDSSDSDMPPRPPQRSAHLQIIGELLWHHSGTWRLRPKNKTQTPYLYRIFMNFPSPLAQAMCFPIIFVSERWICGHEACRSLQVIAQYFAISWRIRFKIVPHRRSLFAVANLAYAGVLRHFSFRNIKIVPLDGTNRLERTTGRIGSQV